MQFFILHRSYCLSVVSALEPVEIIKRILKWDFKYDLHEDGAKVDGKWSLYVYPLNRQIRFLCCLNSGEVTFKARTNNKLIKMFVGEF